MATQRPTPEEKLFAVIQGGSHPPLRPRARAGSLSGIGALLVRVGPLDLPRANQLFTIMVIGFAVAFIVNLLPMTWPHADRLMAQAQHQVKPFTIAAPLEGMRPVEELLQRMHANDPFHLGSAPVEPPSPQDTQEPSPQQRTQEALKDLKIVGISWGLTDSTVMVEQLSDHQTHFLKVGNTIGVFTVKEILQDRVILRVGEHDFELF